MAKRKNTIRCIVALAAFLTCLVYLLVPPLMRVRRIQQAMSCFDNVWIIGQGCKRYASDHSGRFPDSLSEIFDYVELKYFFCPSEYHSHPPKNTKTSEMAASYTIVPGLRESDDPDTVLVCEKSIWNHGGRHVYSIDGRVRFVSVEKIVEKDFGEIARGLSLYFADKASYPTNKEGLETLVISGYLKNVPVDPFDREGKRSYGYATQNIHNNWIITCYGPDNDRDIDLSLYSRGKLPTEDLLRLRTKLVLGMFIVKRTNGDIFRVGP